MDTSDKLMMIFTVLLILFFLSLPFISSGFTCMKKATKQEMEWSYGPIQGCMVKQENGKWIDYDRLRYMED